MFFGAFIGNMMEQHTETESCLGINPRSSDWNLLHTKHIGCSYHMAGDYTNYDGSLNIDLMELVSEVIIDWYMRYMDSRFIESLEFLAELLEEAGIPRPPDLLATWLKIARGLLGNQRLTLRLAMAVVYMVAGSNPSGHVLTTVFNILVNMFAIRYAWSKLPGSTMQSYRESNTCSFFGDDNLISTDNVEFNFPFIVKVLRTLGLTYTDFRKGTCEFDFHPFAEITFLKRGFLAYGDKILAPLDWDVIVETCFWITSGGDPVDRMLANVKAALEEACMWGPKRYEEFRACLRRTLLEERDSVTARIPLALLERVGLFTRFQDMLSAVYGTPIALQRIAALYPSRGAG
jgi:hypothetical protein